MNVSRASSGSILLVIVTSLIGVIGSAAILFYYDLVIGAVLVTGAAAPRRANSVATSATCWPGNAASR